MFQAGDRSLSTEEPVVLVSKRAFTPKISVLESNLQRCYFLYTSPSNRYNYRSGQTGITDIRNAYPSPCTEWIRRTVVYLRTGCTPVLYRTAMRLTARTGSVRRTVASTVEQ